MDYLSGINQFYTGGGTVICITLDCPCLLLGSELFYGYRMLSSGFSVCGFFLEPE